MAKCRHCGGTGQEPERELTVEQWAIVDRIVSLGRERETVSSTRTLAGTQAREAVYKKVDAITDEARGAGIPKVVVAEALGVSRAQLDNILKRSAP